MNNYKRSEDFNKIMSLSQEELNDIFSQLSIDELEDLIDRMEDLEDNE